MSEERYPEWLLDIAAKAIAFSQNPSLEQRWDDEDWGDGRNFWREDGAAVLDALGFMPDYRAFLRADRDRMATDTWSGTVMEPEAKRRRHEALAELLSISWELDDDES